MAEDVAKEVTMRFLCRIGWHVWGKWKRITDTIAGESYETAFQQKECQECNRIVKRHIR